MSSWLSLRLKSFGYAGKGIKTLFVSQPNAQIHLLATALVLAVGLHLGITRYDWAILALTIAMVIAMEAINTGLEFLCDAVHPDQHPLIGKAKDVAAAAVLVCAFAAIVIAGLILLPPFMDAYLT